MIPVYIYLYNGDKLVKEMKETLPVIPPYHTILLTEGLQAKVVKIYLDLDAKPAAIYTIKATLV